MFASNTDFALDNSKSPFHQAYDMSAPALFPERFYTKQQDKVANHVLDLQATMNPLQDEQDVLTRVFLGSMTVVGLFIFFRCVVR